MSSERGRPGERTRRLLTVLLGLGLGLLIAEGVAGRLLPAPWHHLLYRAVDDPVVDVELRPCADFVFEGALVEIPPTRVRTSAQGLRDDELAVPLPVGVRRIACRGDSYTFGWGVEQEQGWCHRLDELLGAGWQTANLGVPGFNTAQEVRHLERVGLALAPDLVVVQHEDGDVEPPLSHGYMHTFAYFAVSHSALARLVRTALGPRGVQHQERWSRVDGVVVGDAGWNGLEASNRAWDRLAEVASEGGFEVVVLSDAPQERATRAHAEALGIRWELLDPAFEGRPRASLLIPVDEHWNAEGHRLVAEHVADRLEALGLLAPE
jgi:hypothetical protein